MRWPASLDSRVGRSRPSATTVPDTWSSPPGSVRRG